MSQRHLTASDRTSLIKLASKLPQGSPERRAILAGLRGEGPEGRLKVHIKGDSSGGGNWVLWKGQVAASDIPKLNKDLNSMYYFSDEEEYPRKIRELEESILELSHEKSKLERESEYLAGLAAMKRWGFDPSKTYMNALTIKAEDSSGDLWEYDTVEKEWARE
jgi:hypothetical protein